MNNNRKLDSFKKRKKGINYKSNKSYSENKKPSSSRRRFGGFKRRYKKSSKELDPQLFINKATPIEEKEYTPLRKYEEINLNDKLQDALKAAKFEYPTEIQEQVLDKSLEGENILGIANTGTGKTGAFLIPIINQLLNTTEKFQTLIIVPTRELAKQVEKDFINFAKFTNLNSVCFVGGLNIRRDFRNLSRFNHLIVGTPGRLIDLVKRGNLKLEKVEILVLDEFDRMLDMGFIEDVRFLIKHIKNIKQTMLFSATFDNKQKTIIDEIIINPFKVMVNAGLKPSDTIEQSIIRLENGEDKFEKLISLIGHSDFSKTMIFAETKRAVISLNSKLKKAGIRSDLIHGDRTQRSREIALDKFKKGKTDFLIATDVASRGLDIEDVTHVINYQPPKDYDSYIHRIGRTGRIGKKGSAVTFVN